MDLPKNNVRGGRRRQGNAKRIEGDEPAGRQARSTAFAVTRWAPELKNRNGSGRCKWNRCNGHGRTEAAQA